MKQSAEEKLKLVEQQSRAWLENSPACTKIVGLDFNLQFMSKAGVIGLNIEDVTPYYGKPYPFHFYPESFKNKMTENMSKAIETGEVIIQEAPVVDTLGNAVWFHSTIVPTKGEDDRVAYLMIVSIDVTARKQAEAELLLAYDETIEGWSHALDLRDKETEGHTLRVTEMAVTLSRRASIPESEIFHVRRGALLHDIGKMGVPDAILLKPNKLTDEEWIIMRKHPEFAFELLSPIVYLNPALDIPYCHHEKWDGSGYPRGLKGEQIPLAARLFAIVDVWDALRSNRPYRQGWSTEKVIEHIKSLSGTHFEPKAVELFLNMMNEDDKDSL